MAAKGSKMSLALIVVLMTWHGAWAQAGCSNAVMSLAPCLNFVTGNSTSPSPSCCSSLAGVIQTQPQCLCSMINGGGPMASYTVNQTLALALPAACNVQSPPVSQCNAVSGPATAPVSAPEGSPSSESSPSDSSSQTPNSSSQTNTPSSSTAGTGSKSTPTTTGASSGARTASSSLPIAVFLSLAISFALKTTKF